MKKIDTFSRNITKHIFKLPAEGTSPERYKIFKRNIIILMMAVTIIPLSVMAAINYYQYQKSLRDEIITPLNVLTNKTKRSFELFLEERLSTVRFIASAYSFDELSDEKIMNRILGVLKKEFEGFVDLAVIDHQGRQISHAGPYSFLGKDYSQQDWFQEALIKGVHISDVFLG